MEIETGYDFDDLLLVPKYSKVNSRDFVDLSVELPNMKLGIPIIASPMKGITSPELIVKLGNLGGLGIVHRFYDDIDKWKKDLKYIANNCENFGVAIGLNEFDKLNDASYYNPKLICIDVANGYLESVKEFTHQVYRIANHNPLVMVGNVVTGLEATNLTLGEGADLIRIGIGTGGLCTTRTVTGVGYPQLSALMNCKERIGGIKTIVADGGIRNSGDAVKCLAAGADLVMIGSLFGHCWEAEHDGTIYGMASQKLQEDYYHQTKSIEGISKVVTKNTNVEKLMKEFTDGMRSAFTYMDACNIRELQENAKWVRKL